MLNLSELTRLLTGILSPTGEVTDDSSHISLHRDIAYQCTSALLTYQKLIATIMNIMQEENPRNVDEAVEMMRDHVLKLKRDKQ